MELRHDALWYTGDECSCVECACKFVRFGCKPSKIQGLNAIFFLHSFLNRRSLWLLDCFTGQSPGSGRNVGHFSTRALLGLTNPWFPSAGRLFNPYFSRGVQYGRGGKFETYNCWRYVCSLYFRGDILKHIKFQAICWDLLRLLLDFQLVGIFPL